MLKRFTFTLLLLLLLPGLSAAASKVVDVDFVGLGNVPETVARSKIVSIEGSKFSSRSVKQDIKRLYNSGLFSDVSVEKKSIGGGVKLIFSVVVKQTVGKLTISGNKKFKGDEIADAIRINEFELLDPAKIAETKNAIYKLYEEKGYYLVDVKTSVEPFDPAKNQVEVIIKVKENRPVKVKRIRFIGNKAFSDKKLRKKMKTKEKGFLSFLSGGGKLQSEKLDVDVQLLRYYYLDNGYLKIKVGEPSVTLTRDKQAIYISIPVYEGEPYKVGSVDVAGDIITTKEELLSKLSQTVGTTYRKSLEIEDLQAIEALYGDQAYAFASIVPQVEANDIDKTARVMYYVQKGPKVKVGKIVIKGNKVTRDKVIRRELRIIENSYFSQSAVKLSRTRLQQLGYFEDINIATPRGAEDNIVDLVIDVKEKNTGTFSIGAGFSTLESFIFTATIQKENFFGRGWSGGVSANISKLRQDLIVSMSDRSFLDSEWFFGLSFQRFNSQLNQDFDQNRFGGSVSFGRELFDFFHIRMGYSIDDIEVLNFSSQVPQFFQANASGLTSAVTAALTYDRRDNRIATKKGYFGTVTGEWSTDYLGASNKYFKVVSDHRLFFKLPKNFVLKGRGKMGYINSTDNSPVPLFNRFFMGGINTLRGYDLNTIGPQLNVPVTATGADRTFTYGGNKMLLFNVELEIPIYPAAGFAAVAFFDAGNSFGEDQNISLSTLRMNYGTGLRWNSPFGPLRFEWGFPINKKSGEPGVVFNFTIGQSF